MTTVTVVIDLFALIIADRVIMTLNNVTISAISNVISTYVPTYTGEHWYNNSHLRAVIKKRKYKSDTFCPSIRGKTYCKYPWTIANCCSRADTEKSKRDTINFWHVQGCQTQKKITLRLVLVFFFFVIPFSFPLLGTWCGCMRWWWSIPKVVNFNLLTRKMVFWLSIILLCKNNNGQQVVVYCPRGMISTRWEEWKERIVNRGKSWKIFIPTRWTTTADDKRWGGVVKLLITRFTLLKVATHASDFCRRL